MSSFMFAVSVLLGGFVAVALAVILGIFLIENGYKFEAFLEHKKYARNAKKHNANARRLRLLKTEYFGYPLPKGKEAGTIIMSRAQQLVNPYKLSKIQLEKKYQDHARDLHVDLEMHYDALTQDLIVSWKPKKGRKARERY